MAEGVTIGFIMFAGIRNVDNYRRHRRSLFVEKYSGKKEVVSYKNVQANFLGPRSFRGYL